MEFGYPTTCDFKDSYQQHINNIYKAQTESVDFLNQADKVREDINAWVCNATKGLMKEMLKPPLPRKTIQLYFLQMLST
ncbi:hypothetical protein K2173_007577 [Erythroxylum novogranatense]|uniref:Serpin domain-containing protein n=1 Tax=Erythroxylum novogranatense TaxID=1862640 RepID=A0AAV8T6K8_9ROSI|nr:hypothetical protein K2173_007577 [Erythroxylum novogranatense]